MKFTMTAIPELPNITSTIAMPDGFMARALCLVYGYPAEVRIEVDTRTLSYSSAKVHMFNPIAMQWDTVYGLAYPELRTELPSAIYDSVDTIMGGRVVLSESPGEVLPALNDLALHMWKVAQEIVTISHRRQDELDVNLYLGKRQRASYTRYAEEGL
jgi:hypothetical protein